jgi:hypothetical protein
MNFQRRPFPAGLDGQGRFITRHAAAEDASGMCDTGPGELQEAWLDMPEAVFQAEPVKPSILATVREAFAGYPWGALGVACTVGAACLSTLLIAVNPGVFLA